MSFVYKHVIIIGLDGAGNFYRNTEAPNIRKMYAEGFGTDYCVTTIPTDSAECWGGMLLGVGPKVHELTNGTIDDTPYGHRDEHPTIFRLIRDRYPDYELGSFANWIPINTRIADEDIGITKDTGPDDVLTDKICDYIKAKKPNFLLIHLGSMDDAGHAHGYDTEPYLKELTVNDGYVGKIRGAIKEAGIEDDALVIATTDHGGIGRGHGGPTEQEKYVFFAAVGKTVVKGSDAAVRTIDLPAIVAHALGVPADPLWESRVPEGLFDR